MIDESIQHIKAGDILYYNKDNDNWIFSFKNINRRLNNTYYELSYYAFCFEEIDRFSELNNSCIVDITYLSHASDEQKQKLLKALKKCGYVWDPINKKYSKYKYHEIKT